MPDLLESFSRAEEKREGKKEEEKKNRKKKEQKNETEVNKMYGRLKIEIRSKKDDFVGKLFKQEKAFEVQRTKLNETPLFVCMSLPG